LLHPGVLRPAEERVVVEVLADAGVDREEIEDDEGDDARCGQPEQDRGAPAGQVVRRGVDGLSLAADPCDGGS
jgi:hypothetical protein